MPSLYEDSYMLDEISIKCCPCYNTFWKEIREKKIGNVKFDDVEKVKSIRKYFWEEKFLCHCCIDCCLKNIILSFSVSNLLEEVNNRKKGLCILKYKCDEMSLEEICDGCIVFVIINRKDDMLLTV